MILAVRWDGSPTGVGRRAAAVVALLGVVLIGAGCLGEPRPIDQTADTTPAAADRPFTLGDVEADEPLRRIRWIQPLADHLAANLASHGFDHGRVIVAQDLEEMARLLSEGSVDLYLDSPLVMLEVARASDAKILLRRWVRNQPEYRSLFVTHEASGLRAPEDLDGKTIACQKRDSTTGFLLPVLTLVERGYEVKTAFRPNQSLKSGRVGCFFTGDEENSVQLLLAEGVAAAVVSNQNFDALPDELRRRLRVLDATPTVPRQLVAVRPDMDPALVEAVRGLLTGITDEDRARLAQQVDGEPWTWRFDEVTPAALARLETYSAKLADLAID